MRETVRKLAHRAARGVTSLWSFLAGAIVILAWLITGPMFRFSPGWQFVMTSGTTIFTFLLVLLLQYTEGRQTRAIQLKLDELIRALKEARTRLVHLEELSDEEMDRLQKEFEALRKKENAFSRPKDGQPRSDQ
jgi:low affinity Fe/Cu permease